MTNSTTPSLTTDQDGVGGGALADADDQDDGHEPPVMRMAGRFSHAPVVGERVVDRSELGTTFQAEDRRAATR